MTKTLLTGIKSPSIGTCGCRGDRADAHNLARHIFELLPPIQSINSQKVYDETVELIETYFGLIIEMSEAPDEQLSETVNRWNR